MKKGNRWDLNALLNSKPHLKALNPQFDKVKESLPLEPENPLNPPCALNLGDSYFKFTIMGQPVPKPRQTRSDKWKERPCVMRYRAWADKAREARDRAVSLVANIAPVELLNTQQVSFVAYLEFPKSYSKKKREALKGTPHMSRGDVDNYAKSLLDALFEEDCRIWKLSGEKRWDDGLGPRIEVYLS